MFKQKKKVLNTDTDDLQVNINVYYLPPLVPAQNLSRVTKF